MMNRETLKGAKIEVQTEGMKEYYVTFRDKSSSPVYSRVWHCSALQRSQIL